MKFLCIDCDEVMGFAERQIPGDGTLAAVFTCGGCDREMAMLTNPMETQLVSSLGVKIGGRKVPEQPMELTRSSLAGEKKEAFQDLEGLEVLSPEERPGESLGNRKEGSADAGTGSPEDPGPVVWTPEAVERLQRVPSFVRGMVKRIYTDYARERGIRRMTPERMDQARTDLGLEGM